MLTPGMSSIHDFRYKKYFRMIPYFDFKYFEKHLHNLNDLIKIIKSIKNFIKICKINYYFVIKKTTYWLSRVLGINKRLNSCYSIVTLRKKFRNIN